MTNDELRELNKKRKIHQIAWVTRDLEKSMKAWVDNLKVGPWTVLAFTEKTLKYLDVDGKRVTEPFKFLIGTSWIGEISGRIDPTGLWTDDLRGLYSETRRRSTSL